MMNIYIFTKRIKALDTVINKYIFIYIFMKIFILQHIQMMMNFKYIILTDAHS